MASKTSPMALSALIALVVGALALVTSSATAKGAPKGAPAPTRVPPKPTNGFAKLTDGLWQIKVVSGGPKMNASLHFNGDNLTYTDHLGTMYGSMSTGKATHHKDGVEFAATVNITVEILHGRAPRLLSKPRSASVHFKLSADGKRVNYCSTAPGSVTAKAPTAAFPKATDDKGLRCFSGDHLTGPALTPKGAERPKKRIKMRTRGLDWSLGR